jgi:hypothetical protein
VKVIVLQQERPSWTDTWVEHSELEAS